MNKFFYLLKILIKKREKRKKMEKKNAMKNHIRIWLTWSQTPPRSLRTPFF
jgi:hypothetical protein